jgi:hypothetical protein
MLLEFKQFGGIVPRITDPRLIPPGHAQVAKNCRFDHGGLVPLGTDGAEYTPTVAGPIVSIFLYDGDGSVKWLAWADDVDAVLAPLPNDSWKRVFYTEAGELRVTDKNLYKQGGTAYPMAYRKPSPPAPLTAPVATVLGVSAPFSMIASVILDSTGVKVTVYDNGMGNISLNWLLEFFSTGVTGLDGVSFAFNGLTIAAGLASFYATGLKVMNSGTITVLSKGNPAECTDTNHGLITGDTLLFSIIGMIELNGYQGTITVVDSSHFTIDGVDSTSYTTFTSGTWTLQSRVLSSGSPLASVFTPVAVSIGTSDNISKANPAKLTQGTAHNLTTGTSLKFYNMVGMVELEGWIGTITVIDAKHFTLDGVDSNDYGTFASGIYVKCSAMKLVDPDPTTLESKNYVQAYVNGYGEVGPPGPVSNLIALLDGDHVSVTGLETGPADPLFWVLYSNIYRLNQDANGNEIFQLVEQVAVATASYTDSLLDSALADVLQSAEWDGPPAGVEGLAALPNEAMACWLNNTLCLSVPSYPHAWPASYQKSMEDEIMGLVAWGNTLVILTQGLPQAITFTDPENSVPAYIPLGFSCLSKRSVVNMGAFSIYAAPEGLIALGQGTNNIITQDIMSRDEWANYAPSSISAYFWENKYVGFYTNGDVQAGFIFDPATKNFVDLDFYATAGCYDFVTGYLFLQVGNDIVSLASNVASPRSLDWKSPRQSGPPSMPQWIKVLATSYPVVVDIIYPQIVDGNGNPAPQTITATVTSKNPQMIGMANAMVDAVDCRVYGTKGATVVYLASDIGELPQ